MNHEGSSVFKRSKLNNILSHFNPVLLHIPYYLKLPFQYYPLIYASTFDEASCFHIVMTNILYVLPIFTITATPYTLGYEGQINFNYPTIKLLLEKFVHLAVCLTTGSKSLPKRALHIVRSKASSFRWEYPLLSLGSSSSFLRLLPRLPVTPIHHFIFPSITVVEGSFYAICDQSVSLPFTYFM
jgi:hypothetical protein